MNFKGALMQFWMDTKGLAFLESAILLPIMLTLLFGMFDLGQAVIINQKVTAAAHMAGDLITRNIVVGDDEMADAQGVAQLVIDPYDRSLLGIDIVGIEFDSDDTPTELWRHTYNREQEPTLPANANLLGLSGEGVVAVSVTYRYTPRFSSPLVGDIVMEETAFLRGRRNSLIRYAED